MMKRVLLLLIPTMLMATPAQVIIIRHAEKSQSGTALTLRGRERAAALVPYFKGNPDVNTHGLPVAMFTVSPHTTQTLQGLSNDIEVQIDSRYSSAEEIAQEITTNPDYEGHMVLVCWSHTEIPTLAKKLGVQKPPKKWADDDYDRLWILNYNEKGEVSFQNKPQKLLFGDSK